MPYKDPEQAKARRKAYYAEHREDAIKRSTEWRLANPEKFREHMHRAYNKRRGELEFLEQRRQWTLKWRANNPEKIVAYREAHVDENRTAALEFSRKHPEQGRASKKLCYEIKMGRIVRPETCEQCSGPGPIEGAHHDYSRPLDVRWLCRSCHRSWDKRQPKLPK